MVGGMVPRSPKDSTVRSHGSRMRYRTFLRNTNCPSESSGVPGPAIDCQPLAGYMYALSEQVDGGIFGSSVAANGGFESCQQKCEAPMAATRA
eukprot:1326830-Rhodomonas_salina.1